VPHDLHSCRIDIPSYLAAGHWNLVVIANGIPSDPVAVHIHEPHNHHEAQFVGKIERLVYDRFGDFEAFALESASGQVRHFESREPHIAELAMRAWQEHWRRYGDAAAERQPRIFGGTSELPSAGNCGARVPATYLIFPRVRITGLPAGAWGRKAEAGHLPWRPLHSLPRAPRPRRRAGRR